MRVDSILGARRWDEAARVIAMHDGGEPTTAEPGDAEPGTVDDLPPAPSPRIRVTRERQLEAAAALHEAHQALPRVALGDEVRELLVALLREVVLAVEAAPPSAHRGGSLLTDRTFLAKVHTAHSSGLSTPLR